MIIWNQTDGKYFFGLTQTSLLKKNLNYCHRETTGGGRGDLAVLTLNILKIAAFACGKFAMTHFSFFQHAQMQEST
jgi:hypothetical protein